MERGRGQEGASLERQFLGEGSYNSPDAQEKGKFQEEGQKDGIIPLAEAWDRKTEMVSLEESIGRPIGEFINLYPPGIPLLVPGERMTEGLCGDIRSALEQGLQVQGIQREKRLGEEEILVPVIL